MLIITRRPVETVEIGDDCEVTVLGVKGNQVRLGINAPKNVRVDRKEIGELKRREALAAAGKINGNVAGPQDPGTQG